MQIYAEFLLRNRQNLFYLLACEGIGLVAAKDEDLAVHKYLLR